jgi:hypothetical protein
MPMPIPIPKAMIIPQAICLEIYGFSRKAEGIRLFFDPPWAVRQGSLFFFLRKREDWGQVRKK